MNVIIACPCDKGNKGNRPAPQENSGFSRNRPKTQLQGKVCEPLFLPRVVAMTRESSADMKDAERPELRSHAERGNEDKDTKIYGPSSRRCPGRRSTK